MLIRIVKRLPAPVMDDFDVRRFEVGKVYDVDAKLGRYLLLSQYAERVDAHAVDKTTQRRDEK